MKRYIYLLFLLVTPFGISAQSDDRDDTKKSFDEFRASMMGDFQTSRSKIFEEYNDFRTEALKGYIDFVRKAWDAFEISEPLPVPDEKPVPPVIIPEEERVLPVDDKHVGVTMVIAPVDIAPQPQPFLPVEPVPLTVEKRVTFKFFGTQADVRFDAADKVTLTALAENSIADALEKMTAKSHDNMILDCLEIRERLCLSDWAYINMLNELSRAIYGNDISSATLLMAYLYMSSGYKMRLAMNDTRLYMLYASRHYVYEQPYFVVDGVNYYCIEPLPFQLEICKASFDEETPLSLVVTDEQHFAFEPAQMHSITSVDYPDFVVDVIVNKNNLDFYGTVPSSMIGDNIYTRWAIYANTPMDTKITDKLYPELKRMLSGLSELDAANRILNLVQTGFEYRRDEELWETDRVFFPDECLYYSSNDCDDRSVLFSRLVRDVMGLDAVLVFVPGHVLVGVEFNTDVKGGHITLGDRKFTLCEPTCTNGAPVGWNNIKEGTDLNVYLLER